MSILIDNYNYLFKELADPRVYDWPLMSNPLGISLIIYIYLYLVLVAVPAYMTNRKPYDLRLYISLYNVFQILACFVVIYRVLTAGWTTHYKLVCQPVDYSENEMALCMASNVWWIFILKIIELSETVVFAMRKKFNQITVLHVYHHSSTVCVLWFIAKYFPGGMTTFGSMLNSGVHIIMYTYYLLSSFGPKIQKKLEIIKNKITLIQIVQLCILIVQAVPAFFSSCEVSSFYAYVMCADVSIVLAFFLNFYIRNFIVKKKKNS